MQHSSTQFHRTLDLHEVCLQNNIHPSGWTPASFSHQRQQGSRLRSHLHNGVAWQPDQQHKLLPQPVRGPPVHFFPAFFCPLLKKKNKKNPFSAPSAKCPRRCVKAHDQTSERADYNPTQRKGSSEHQPPPPPCCIFHRVSCTGCSPHMTSMKVPYGRWGRRGSPASSCVARASLVRMSESTQKIIITEIIWLKCVASETIREEKLRSTHGSDHLSTKITN